MVQFTIDHALQLAIQHHHAGRLNDAETIYRQVLTEDPKNPEAMRLLGVVAMQVGQHDVALNLITQAIELNQTAAEYRLNLGRVYREMNRLEDAIAAYRDALELDPD